MSKYLEEKKENIQRVNQLVNDLNSMGEVREQLAHYKDKYARLLKKYEELDSVFQFHKRIVQNISSGIITTDQKGEITFLNKSALDLLRYSSREILGKPIHTLFAEEDKARDIFHQIFEEEKMFESQEVNLKSSRDEIIPIGFSTTVFEFANGQHGVVFIFRDIRDQINFRRQMSRMDRLATLGELAAGLAHEIRNPLGGIKTSSEVLLETFSPGDFRAQLVSRVVKEIDRSNALLQRFFNFAKPSRPKPAFHSLPNIVDGVFLLLRSRMLKKNVSYKTEFGTDSTNIYIDESQFEQVVLNLLLNAMDAMPKGGHIDVISSYEPDLLATAEQREPGVVMIKVRDNGAGIPPEKIENIFLPFYTTKSDGVGLGLSICTRLLDENAGRLEVDSVWGEGTEFTIYLPYIKQNQQES